jgi:hypothetical protein
VERITSVVLDYSLSQLIGQAYILLPRTRDGIKQVNISHGRRNTRFLTGLPAVACTGGPSSHEATADAPAFAFALRFKAKAGAGDETRTRDVLLGKEVLYH